MDRIEGRGFTDVLQERLTEEFGAALVIRWIVVADVLHDDDTRDLVALSDGASVAWESKALVREALHRRLWDDEDEEEVE